MVSEEDIPLREGDKVRVKCPSIIHPDMAGKHAIVTRISTNEYGTVRYELDYYGQGPWIRSSLKLISKEYYYGF